jgi:hypothetical protein
MTEEGKQPIMHIDAEPSLKEIEQAVRTMRQFGLVLDVPKEDTRNGGRHVWLNPTRKGLLNDVREWFEEGPGPRTAAHIRSIRARIRPLKRGEIAHGVIVRTH